MVQCVGSAISIAILYYDVVALASPVVWLWWGGLVLVSVWWINVFNFLDGIDGYAISEAVFICFAATGLCLYADAVMPAQLFLLLVASISGFIIINWSPARLFMGDVGSYFLGFIIAMLAVLTVREQLISPLSWLVLTALFWVDASYTLLNRLHKGERWYQAHRSHAYQILSRRWDSHHRVSVLAILINLGWLLPISYYGQWLWDDRHIVMASLLSIVACLPIVWGVFKVKSEMVLD
jgi:Fuc2NAc and GlcNAc transferase